MTSRKVKEVGSREEVYNGLALRTSGGLERHDIVPKVGPDGRVLKFLSKKRQEIARANFERQQALFRPGAKRKGDREYAPSPTPVVGHGHPAKRARTESKTRTPHGVDRKQKRARTESHTPHPVEIQHIRTYPPLRPRI